MKRVFIIVLDSFGIGELPDAAAYGTAGAILWLPVMLPVSFTCPICKSWDCSTLTVSASESLVNSLRALLGGWRSGLPERTPPPDTGKSPG